MACGLNWTCTCRLIIRGLKKIQPGKNPSHQHRTVCLDIEQILVLISQSAAQHHKPLSISVCLSLQMWLSYLSQSQESSYSQEHNGLSRLILALFTSSSLNLGNVFNLRFGWLRNYQEKNPGFLYSSIIFFERCSITPASLFFPKTFFKDCSQSSHYSILLS